jgi:DNA-binding response OmpR family regulator
VRYTFLLVGKEMETGWPLALQQALFPLGKLTIVPEEEAAQTVAQGPCDLVIIDAGHVRDAFELTSQLRTRQPGLRVIVATASPTWQRAREAMKAGAADYIRKSLDEKGLRARIEAVLELGPPTSSS